MKSTLKFTTCSLLMVLLALSTHTSIAAETAQRTPQRDPFDETVVLAPYMEAAIPRPAQQAVVAEKLARLAQKTGRKPNVLILLVDDLGWGDVGAFGGGVAIGAPTPQIDAMASAGLKLTSAYSQPTCTPTRAAMMTGRLPFRSGLTRPILSGEQPSVNPWAAEVTAASLLSAAGYRTAHSGKWHLGEIDGARPHQVGYDEYLGIMGAVSEYSQGIDANLYPNLVNKPERLARFHHMVTSAVTRAKKGGSVEVVKELKTTEDLGEIDQQFADYSADFIRRTVADKKPFYLFHSFSRVHNDNYPAKGYRGKSPAAYPYKDAVVEVDDIVGRLMRVLKDTGQLDNTLVVFASDNGPNEDTYPDAGHTPFRGGKGTTWEGGVRTPMIAYWPGMIKPGRQSDGLFDLSDIFNTSLAVAGVGASIPTTRFIDGIDQSGFLLADEGQSARQTVFMYTERTLAAVRWQEFKVHFKVFQTNHSRQNIDESTLQSVGMSPWVYNLYMDPKEQVSSGHRYFEWGLPRILGFVNRHIDSVRRYPPKDIGLGVAAK